jgi:hypothetical protein
MEGLDLRSEAYRTATPIDTLPASADGSRRVSLSLDPADGGLRLPTEGVYPVQLIAQDGATNPLASLVTHLIVGPDPADESPPLGVAVVAEIAAPPALHPDGTTTLAPADVDDLAQITAGMAAVPGVAASLAVQPETIDALATIEAPEGQAVVDGLRQAAVGREVLASPYVAVSPDGLVDADLVSELGPQLYAGAVVLTERLGATPVGSSALAPDDLGGPGLDLLATVGVQGLVVADGQVEPLDPGIIRFSLAQPFLLTADDGTAEVQALATDDVVLERMATTGSPGLVVSRVLSELALLRLEQPSLARSTVLPLPTDTPANVVQLLLEGLAGGRPFAATTLSGAFTHAAPLLDRGGNQVDRPLVPAEPDAVPPVVARSLGPARADLITFAGLVGDDIARVAPLDRHLLVAPAEAIPVGQGAEHIATVEGAIDLVTGQVSTPATFTLTLTARDGTIPLTITNTSGLPLHVTVHLRSQKLEFPDGDAIDLVLTEENQRIDIRVRALTSGAFPLQIDVTTPDGDRRLSTSRYTVRSTAISGAGLVLSIGAGAFLVVWWARHWHRTRRSAKLVASEARPTPHPEP